jgi:hypothetical protein
MTKKSLRSIFFMRFNHRENRGALTTPDLFGRAQRGRRDDLRAWGFKCRVSLNANNSIGSSHSKIYSWKERGFLMV